MGEKQTERVGKGKSVDKVIDIEQVLIDKNPRLAKYVPKFFITYLERITHLNKLNEFLVKNAEIKGAAFVDLALQHFGLKLRIHGIENLDTDEKILIASNHPLGGLDSLGLMKAVSIKNKDFVFLVNDILMNIPSLRSTFIPVNKHGSQVKEAMRVFEDVMMSDKTVIFFPAGLVSRKVNGQIVDLEWKKTFVTKSRSSGRKIIPVYIDGQNSNFFYNLANLRKFLRIKANLEMFYLVDEMYKQYDKVLHVYIGEPISLEEMPTNLKDKAIAGMIKDYVYKLPEKFAANDEFISIDFNRD